jgi:ketosteroid isomerase-like protein
MNAVHGNSRASQIGRATTRCALLSVLATGLWAGAQTEPARQGRPLKTLNAMIPVLRAAYAAFNRGDFDSAVASLDTHIEWTEPAEFPGGGTYHGREAVKGYLKKSREGWTEGSSEPERFITSRDRIVIFVHARFRPKNSDQWQEVRLADVYTVHYGKIVQMHAFADRNAALKWAGAAGGNP